jgi:hypothetical protein
MLVPIRVLGLSVFCCMLLAFAPSVGTARAQASSQNPSQLPAQNPRSGPFGGKPPMVDPSQNPDDRNALSVQQEATRRRLAMNDRQKKIVDDTAKLLQLANELKTDVDKTTKDEMSLDVIRKADEIERLAHDVKQRMKG